MAAASIAIQPTSNQEHNDIPLYLAIDGGGTKTKVSIVGRKRDGDEKSEWVILATGISDSSNHTSVGIKTAMLSIGQATVQALRALPDRSDLEKPRRWSFNGLMADSGGQAPFKTIWAGLSGVDGPSDVDLLTIHLKTLFGLPTKSGLDGNRLLVTNDGDLLSAAILKHYQSNKLSTTKLCKGGVVLIAGTGSIAIGFGPQKNDHHTSSKELITPLGRLGGYGFLLGDEGSAYYVGQQTIKEILRFNDYKARIQEIEVYPLNYHASISIQHRHHHQMIAESQLIPMILSHFEINHLNDLLSTIYSIKVEQQRKLKIAELSRLVMRCGFSASVQQPDKFSRMILNRSAERLSELVADLCHLYQLDPNQMVLCLGGGMWTYSQFGQLVLETMRIKWGASWGWIEIIDQPDQAAALSLP